MSTKQPPVAEQPAIPTADQVSDYLVGAFTKLFSYDEIMNNRRRCFATIINYESPKSGIKVKDILTADEVGVVLDRIRDVRIQRAIGEAGF